MSGRAIQPAGPAVPDSRRYVVAVLEGASDRPMAELGGRTPLAVAKTPTLDACAGVGRVGQADLLGLAQPPKRNWTNLLGRAPAVLQPCLPEKAMAALLGIPVDRVPPRGVLERLGRPIAAEPSQAVARLEPLRVVDGRLEAVGVPQLSIAELGALADAVVGAQLDPKLRVAGVFEDAVMLVDAAGRDPVEVVTSDPWSLLGKKPKKHLPAGGALGQALSDFVLTGAKALDGHEVNATRQELGHAQVTHLWPWGIGRPKPGPNWSGLTGLSGAMLTTSPWARGLAQWLQMESVEPAGEDLEAIRIAAEQVIDRVPVTVLHVTAPALASAEGTASGKEACIRQVDMQLLAPLWAWMQNRFDEPRLLVTPGIGVRTGDGAYLPDAVPFVMTGHRVRSVVPRRMTEADGQDADLQIKRGHELLEYFLFSGTRH